MTNPHLQAARTFARLMDSQFSVMGVSFGLDTILGIVPGAGDLLTLVLSGYLIWIGYQMKLPAEKLGQMLIYVIADAVIGAVPFLGDVGDIFFKANEKNLKILEKFAADELRSGKVEEGEVI